MTAKPAPYYTPLMLKILSNMCAGKPYDTGCNVPIMQIMKATEALVSRGWIKNGRATAAGYQFVKDRKNDA